MSYPRQRVSNPAQARAVYFAQNGSAWSLTGNLLASTLVYMGLYLAIAVAGAYLSAITGVDEVVAGAGSIVVIPLLGLVFLVSFLLNRAVGHVGRELLLGGVMMLIMSPILSLIVGSGLATDPHAVVSAVLAVGGSLVVTAAIAAVSPWDLSRLGGLAMVGLLGLIVTQVLALFLAPAMGLVMSPVWSFIGILVFELYLVVDLSRIRQAMPYGPNDALAAYIGLGLALDVVNLFIYFLSLFLGGVGRRS
ncbi:MAG: Bax inhibitor-1/YccA family protein [Clostridia bacterium]